MDLRQMTYKDLAPAAEIDPSSLSRILNNGTRPRRATLNRIAAVLGVRPEELKFKEFSVLGLPSTGANPPPNEAPPDLFDSSAHIDSGDDGGARAPTTNPLKEAVPMSQASHFIAANPGMPTRVLVETDSMAPTVEDGDLVLFDASRRPKTGSIVLASAGERVVLGRLARDLDNLYVTFDNPDYGTDRNPVTRIIATAVTLIREL